MIGTKKVADKTAGCDFYEKIGMVARWKPVHLGHQAVLNGLCGQSSAVMIGIGSSNTYDCRNPFTLKETEDMLHQALSKQTNYSIIPVPDLHNGPRWREMVFRLFGSLDVFVTENPYVAELMSVHYRVVHPVIFVPPEERVKINGTMVRALMAQGNEWESLVPESVRSYILENGLDDRFRKEFGLETLALNAMIINERNE